VVLGGGSHTQLATYLIPPIIERLAGLDPPHDDIPEGKR